LYSLIEVYQNGWRLLENSVASLLSLNAPIFEAAKLGLSPFMGVWATFSTDSAKF
jgi:hypothetical protein